ncbi:glycoside hydrolase family 172 protein [Sporolactobacillus terrae]|uniref:glycoside hydrolase family 172 protein n=1 Tax=Sporolactobacillus terrae TaxID=269673 RepID=UPI00111A02DE|nr:glycoside hydrolase family 172 protein [Sporolactobacillus terrae]
MLDLQGIENIKDEESHSINPENPYGKKGQGATTDSYLGKSRKGRAAVSLKEGETLTIAEIHGPGTIKHIWMTIAEATPKGSFVLRDVVLRIYWDDEEYPSIESPIGDFFCNGFGTRCDINSLPIVVNPTGGMNCYFPMPFNKKAKITVTNEHPNKIDGFFYNIDYVLQPELPENVSYFHAKWNRQKTTQLQNDYTIIDNIKGVGHYIGTFLEVTALERYWWGEGEFKFFIDGDSEFPSITSTGTEDYFGGAWAFHKKDKRGRIYVQPYNTPFMGYPFFSKEDHTRDDFQTEDAMPLHGFGNDALPMHGLYRWHLPDPIRFKSDLRVTLQQIGNDDIKLFERSDDVASVAYWYQKEPHQTFSPLLPRENRIPR